MTFKSSLPWITRALALIGIIAIVIFLFQTFFNSFSVATTSFYSGDFAYPEMAIMDGATGADEAVFARSTSSSIVSKEAVESGIDEKIIKTGALELVVDHADESLATIETLTQNQGGYIQTSTIREQEDGTKSGYVVMRIPAEHFDAALDELKALALVVERETTDVQDVTEQYIDLSARLENAKVQEVRYREILAQAKDVEDILAIEQALGNIRSTIESLQGQIQYYDRLTGFATITVDLSEEPIVTIGGKEFRPGTSVKQAVQAVVAMAQGFVVAIIWIAVVGVGIGVPVVLIGWLGWKLIHRLRRR